MTHDIYYDKGFHLFPKWWNIWSCKISSWVQRKKFKMSFCSPLTQRWDLFKHRTENLLRLLGDPFCANFSSHLLLAREVDENGLKTLPRYWSGRGGGWGGWLYSMFWFFLPLISVINCIPADCRAVHLVLVQYLPREKRETRIIGGGSGWLGGTQADTWLLMTLPPPSPNYSNVRYSPDNTLLSPPYI